MKSSYIGFSNLHCKGHTFHYVTKYVLFAMHIEKSYIELQQNLNDYDN
jgi:hypothetical protein